MSFATGTWISTWVGGIALLLCAEVNAQVTVPGSYPTIQAAISAVAPGTVIQVFPGVYFENIDYQGKDVVVQAVGAASQTIIDGGFNGPVVQFRSLETAAAVLDGFAIRHGRGGQGTSFFFGGVGEGGGINIENASPTIRGCIVSDCRGGSAVPSLAFNGTGGGAGGIQCTGSHAAISGCTITRNTGGRGAADTIGSPGGAGGIGIGLAVVNVTGTSVIDNVGGSGGISSIVTNVFQAGGGGGGMDVRDGTLHALSCVVVQNRGGASGNCGACAAALSPAGAGGLSVLGSASVVGCTIADNLGGSVGLAGRPGAGAIAWTESLCLQNTIVWGNTSAGAGVPVLDPLNPVGAFLPPSATMYANYCNAQTLLPGISNTTLDPQFVAPSSGDYRLQLGSPMVDVGTPYGWVTRRVPVTMPLPSTDADGLSRLNGNAPDVGAYEQSGVPGAILPADDITLCTSPWVGYGNCWWPVHQLPPNVAANPLNPMVVSVGSYGGSLGGLPFLIGAQLLPPGGVFQTPVFSGIHLDPASTVILGNGTVPLGPNTADFLIPVLSGFTGWTLLIQAVVPTNLAANGNYAISAHHVVGLP